MYTQFVQKIAVISFLLALPILATAFILFNKPQTLKPLVQTPAPTSQKKETDIKASFSIVTGNITRSFRAEKYHNQSPDVYIESLDPTIVHVKKINISWNDFFKTLPMTLTKDCLITGDGETLCDGKDGILKFYLNDTETPNLLDQKIKDGDKALIIFQSS